MMPIVRQVRFLPVLVVLVVGLAGTYFAWTVTRRGAEQDLRQQFELSTVRAVLRLHGSIDRPLAQLHGLLGLHAASGEVTPEEWSEFARGVGTGSGDDPLVSCIEIRLPDGLGGPAKVLCEPPERAPTAAALQQLRETMQRSARTRRPQLSPLIRGLLGSENTRGVALVAPVLRSDGVDVERATRWVAVVLYPGGLVGDAVEPIAGDISMAVFDGRGTDPDSRYYGQWREPRAGELTESVPARVAGRDLWLRISPSPEFLRYHASATPRNVLCAGLLITSVALLMIVNVTRTREAALRLSRVTAEREAEALRAREAVEAASAAKDRFVAMMSHELRTPLTAIMGHTEILLQDSLSPAEREESVRTLDRNAHHLLRMLNELLDYSKLDAGAMRIERVPCSIVRVIEDAAGLLRLSARTKGLEISTEYGFPLPASVSTDPVRLHQILVNIIGNAVKFTANGTIRVRAGVDSEAMASRLWVEVEDRGIGIGSEHMKSVFEPFYQGDASMARRFGGTGLGLAISRELAVLMGGDLKVESVLGVGSTFLLTLAVEPVDERRVYSIDDGMDRGNIAQTPIAGALTGSVLLVDDSEDNRRLVAHWLRRAGANVAEAADGAQAVDLVRSELRGGRGFDLVLLDLQMPVMDGCEAAAAMRRDGLGCPIVALTANLAEGDRELSLRAGCDDHLLKPVERAMLLRLCAAWLHRARAAAAA